METRPHLVLHLDGPSHAVGVVVDLGLVQRQLAGTVDGGSLLAQGPLEPCIGRVHNKIMGIRGVLIGRPSELEPLSITPIFHLC